MPAVVTAVGARTCELRVDGCHSGFLDSRVWAWRLLTAIIDGWGGWRLVGVTVANSACLYLPYCRRAAG
ncbi:hypothetical protein [Kribbella albertanoniae]|uniref:hypothetical protein n=1 Tax=Kribbella albertanoniae TaxID=1266829 RepID=UPI00104C4A1A|nr:hypothetical protein [Kribbella albertanoniae]